MKAILFILLICPNYGTGQHKQTLTATKIHFSKIGEKVEIWYDLPSNRDSVIVSLTFYKKSDPTFKYVPKHLNGDVGKGLFSGPNKKITWKIKKEPTYLFTGSGFYFMVRVRLLPKDD